MALSCNDLRRLLDAEAPLDTGEACEHLASCPGCREAVTRWERVEAQLGAWGSEPTPPFLHARLMAHVRGAGRQRSTPRLRRFWWAPTLATALLVAAFGIVRTPPRAPRPPESPSPAMPAAAPDSAAPQSSPGPATPAAPQTVVPSESGPGPVRGLSATRPQARAAACELVGPDGGGASRRLRLLAAWAPPQGVAWTIIVAASGEVRSEVPENDPGHAVPLETLEALASLNLQPGRYRLQRVR